MRKTLGIDFEGFTHPERFLILTTPFPFDALYAQCSRNYFSDAQEWCALFKVSGDDGKGLWRLLFPTRPGETEEQAFDDDTVQQRLQNFFPKAGDYAGFSPQHLQRAPAGGGERSARAASSLPATPPTSTIRSAGSA